MIPIIIVIIILSVFGYYVYKGYKGDSDLSKKKLVGYEKVGGLFRTLGWLSLISGVVFGFIIFTEAEPMPDKIIGAVIIFFLLPILYFPLGKAIRDHKPWGRTVGNLVGVVALFGVPIGTLIGLYVLIVMNKTWDDQSGKIADDPTNGLAAGFLCPNCGYSATTVEFKQDTLFCPKCGDRLEKGNV